MVSDALANISLLAGRILYGSLLALMATKHFTRLEHLTTQAAAKKIPFPKVSVLGAGTLLFLGALSILLGFHVWIGVLLLTVFFIPVTFLMHSFWNDADPLTRMHNQVNFLKNCVILGTAWVFLSIPQPWAYSLSG